MNQIILFCCLQSKLDQIRQRQQMMSVPRNVSASNIDLNQTHLHQQSQMNNPWTTNPMQQAQSMAQLNSNPGMQWQQQQQQQQAPHWTNNFEVQHMNGSNMSLNLPPTGYFYPPDNRPPPPVWMNNWGAPQMYPYPVSMVPMTPLIGHPRSRGPSRNQSRAASPSLSVKSRRSMISSRHHRNSYNQDLTDDEDSDLSDRDFGNRSNRGGSRRNSHSQKNSTMNRRSSRHSQDFDNSSDRERQFLNKRSSRTESEIIAATRRSPSPVSLRRSPDRLSSFEKPVPIKKEPQQPSISQPSAPIKRPEPIKQNVQEVKNTKPKPNAIASKAEFESELKVNVPQVKKITVPEIIKSSSEEEIDDEEDAEEEEEEEISDYKENINKPEEVQLGSTHTTVYPGVIEEDDLGPPPSAPDHEWECEHCTFVNEANVQICLVCCKTPTLKPKPTSILKQTTSPSSIKESEIRQSSPPIVTKSTAPVKSSSTTNKNETGLQKTTMKITKSTSKDLKLDSKKTLTNANPEPQIKLKLKNSTVNSVKSKFENASTSKPITLKPGATTSEESSSDPGKMKGRTLRKISFWPGTKTK